MHRTWLPLWLPPPGLPHDGEADVSGEVSGALRDNVSSYTARLESLSLRCSLERGFLGTSRSAKGLVAHGTARLLQPTSSYFGYHESASQIFSQQPNSTSLPSK